jgi:hypothetical protein
VVAPQGWACGALASPRAATRGVQGLARPLLVAVAEYCSILWPTLRSVDA